METFDVLGPLPTDCSTTVLEASAGTGKTFTLAALVTRYVAEGRARLDEMLLITFGRAATQELRERVRRALHEALDAFGNPAGIEDNQVLENLINVGAEEFEARRARLQDALASFDAATIATTHQFCNLVLKSLGVAGDSDAGVELVESLDDLVADAHQWVQRCHGILVDHGHPTPAELTHLRLGQAREIEPFQTDASVRHLEWR